ncbi:MAG TPA: hypothetical protein PKW39_01590 [Rectinema sp.]|nr:hypothetical protein [Rectinema sp.]
MNARRFWIFSIIICLLFIGLVYQTTRYAALRTEVRELERSEMDLLKVGRELDANIAKLANLEHIERAAIQKGMKVAAPEQRIIVTETHEKNASEVSNNGKQ